MSPSQGRGGVSAARSASARRGIATAALLLLTATSAAAQPAQIRAELRTGTVVETSVERVEPWGFVVSRQGGGLMFRHIRTVRTSSDSLAGLIGAQLPGVPTLREGTDVVFDIAALDLPLRSERAATARRALRPYIAGAAGASVGLETGFAATSRFTGPVVWSALHLASRSPVDGDYLGGFAFGAALELPTPAATLTVAGQVWARYPNLLASGSPSESIRERAPNAASVSVTASRPLGPGGMRGFVGVRGFVFDVDRAGSPLSGLVGLSTLL